MSEKPDEGNVAALRKRVDRVMQQRRRWDAMLREIYDYVLPYRNDFASAQAGDTLTDNIFDGTAPTAAFKFAGRMQNDLTPPFQQFFKLFAGPLLNGTGDKKKQLDEDLEVVSQQVSAAISTSSYHLASHEMYLDLFAGTGAMFINEGDNANPVLCSSVPILELGLEAGPYGAVWGRHWVRAFPAEQLPQMWPEGKFSEALKTAIASEGDKPISICQSTVWNPVRKLWDYTVFEYAGDGAGKSQAGAKVTSSDGAIHRGTFRKSPWITPRFMVVPGEPYGRGPAMLALPFVKTLNKAVEMDLKAAALALYGIWLSRDDDFNENTMRWEPGAVWNVGSTGGSLGPSLVKADVPGRFDLSRVVTDEQRMQIKRAMFDNSLPPDGAAVRSATEIMERMTVLNQEFGGVLGRLTLEIIQPTVERVIEILANKKVLKTELSVDQLMIGLKVVSPVADSQSAAQARKVVDYAQMISLLHGPAMLPRYVRDEAFVDLGRSIGVAEKHITNEAERKKFDDAVAQQRAAENNADIQKEIVKAAAQQAPQQTMAGIVN